MTLLVSLLYLLMLLLIGIVCGWKSRTVKDYFLAGGRLRLIPVTFATMTSIMSGFVFVGGPGLFYKVGLSSLWIIISSSFTGAMMCWILAKPLLLKATAESCLTVPDVILSRFGCRVSSGLSAVGILLGVIGYLGVQLQALGVILSSVFSIRVETGLFIGVAVLAFYTIAGGMLASVYTDILQGALMLWAATLIFYFSLSSTGGLAEGVATLRLADPEFLSPWGSVGIIAALGWFFVFSIGSLGQPHVVHKFMMVENLRILSWFPIILAVSMLLCGLVWLGAGFAVKVAVLKGMVAPPVHPDQTIALFLEQLVPEWMRALANVAILAAIMSTADSFANVGAAALSRDLPKALGFKLSRELMWGRIWSLALFLAATLFALFMGELVAYLGILAFGCFAASLTPSLSLGLNWAKPDRRASRTSIAMGLFSVVGLTALEKGGLISPLASPELLGLTISFLVFIVVGGLWSGNGYHPGLPK